MPRITDAAQGRGVGRILKESKALDEKMVKTFQDNKIEVVTLSAAEYQAWLDVAQKSSYDQFAKEVPDGKKLIDEALAVK